MALHRNFLEVLFYFLKGERYADRKEESHRPRSC